MKTCFKCHQPQPLSEFYKHAQMADGHLNKCKTCTKLDSGQHRSKNIERVRAYDRSRGCRKTTEQQRAYRSRNPEKYRAYSMVARALLDGTIIKPEHCEVCESGLGLHAHHDDYSKPLSVRWLCAAHHHQLHVKIGDTDA